MKKRIIIVALLAPLATHVAAQEKAQSYAPDNVILAATSPHAETVIVRYGWEIVATDVGAIVLATATNSPAVLIYGYLVGGSAIHIAHGNGGRAVGSLGLRVVLPRWDLSSPQARPTPAETIGFAH